MLAESISTHPAQIAAKYRKRWPLSGALLIEADLDKVGGIQGA